MVYIIDFVFSMSEPKINVFSSIQTIFYKFWLICQTRLKKYIIDLNSLSYTLPSWQCCTQYSTVALGVTQSSATITCKWKLMTNIEKMHSSFPRR